MHALAMLGPAPSSTALPAAKARPNHRSIRWWAPVPIAAIAAIALAAGCACHRATPEARNAPVAPRTAPAASAPAVDPFASSETRAHASVEPVTAEPSPPVLLHGGTVMTAAGGRFEPGFVRMQNGIIVAVGAGDGPTPE